MTPGRKLLGSLLLALALGVSGCNRRPPPLAELMMTAGQVERDHAEKLGAFGTAAPGEEFFLNDGVRTGKKSRASLRLSDKSSVAVDENTLIRFRERRGAGKGNRLDVEMGQAELTAGDEGVSIETAFGTAELQPKTRVLLTRTGDTARIEVAIGSAVLDINGKRVDLVAGQDIEVGIDLAVIERAEAGAPSASAPAPAASAEAPSTGINLQISGDGAKVRGPSDASFKPTPAGNTPVEAGSTVDLPAGASAVLSANGEQTTLGGPGQFVIGGSSESMVKTQGGTIQLNPRGKSIAVAVPGGTVAAEEGSQATLRTDKNGTTVSVGSGAVTLQGTKETQTLHGGEEAVLERGGTIRRSRIRGIDHADILAPAGDSFVVHDPKPPTAVGFMLPASCSGTGILELVGQKNGVSGEGRINVALGSGTHRYQLRCIGADGSPGEPLAKGAISIIADGGTRRLPTSAPATMVEADGRNYNVLYQNQLPKIIVRWPHAPEAGPYDLKVNSSPGRSQSVTTGSASYTFSSGSLAEGTHQLTFEGGGRHSKTTIVEIHFDNATPTASISSPAEGGFGAGSEVTVAGSALPGWVVSVNGASLPMDDQHRFSGAAAAPGGLALAIRFSHPQRGTHYYLRRVAGSAR